MAERTNTQLKTLAGRANKTAVLSCVCSVCSRCCETAAADVAAAGGSHEFTAKLVQTAQSYMRTAAVVAIGVCVYTVHTCIRCRVCAVGRCIRMLVATDTSLMCADRMRRA